MNITYFLTSFVAGRCFCIQHIDRLYDVVAYTLEIIYFICRRIPLFIDALLTYQLQTIDAKNRIVKHLPFFRRKSPRHDDSLLS